MRFILLLFLVLLNAISLCAQDSNTKNIFLVTLDGFRWQELFHGADSAILYDKEFVKDIGVQQQYGGISHGERREKLMPFFWNTIGKQGQLYGNRDYNNKVNCSNNFLFSYPGYSELLVGFVDKSLHSNKKIENPNSNVLEFIESQPEFENKVAVFSTWDVIPSVAREATNGIPMNTSGEVSKGSLSERELLLNELEETIFGGSQRSDVFTFYQAFEYTKRNKPNVLFISFDETDSHAHGGQYDQYLKSAHKTDMLLRKLWEWIQSEPEYKDQTTLMITTDHGRGKIGNDSWKQHGAFKFSSSETWIAVIGPDTEPSGERTLREHFFQNQIASTMALFLGLNYSNTQEVGEYISPMMSLDVLNVKASGKLLVTEE